jgi:hypothetical protein
MAHVPLEAAPEATTDSPSPSHAPTAFVGLILVPGFGAVFLSAFVACLWTRHKERRAVRRVNRDALLLRHLQPLVSLVPFHGIYTNVPPELYRLVRTQHRNFAKVSVTILTRYEESSSAVTLESPTAPSVRGHFPSSYSLQASDAPQVEGATVQQIMNSPFIRPNSQSAVPLNGAAPLEMTTLIIGNRIYPPETRAF